MRTREELITETIRCREMAIAGHTLRYPLSLKKEAVEAVADGRFSSGLEFNQACGLHSSAVSGWKLTLAGKIQARSVAHGAGRRYSVSTKIQCVEMVLHEHTPMVEVCKRMDISSTSLTNWVSDYQAGLYSLENVTQVSRKKFKTYEVLLGELDKIKSNLDDKKNEIKEALKKEYEDKLSLVA